MEEHKWSSTNDVSKFLPSTVIRKQTGSFQEAFSKNEEAFKSGESLSRGG